MVRRSLGPEHDAEDVVQEVFMCLFKRLPTLREPQALKGFVIAVTLRTLRHVYRRAKVRRWVGLSPTTERAELGVVHADAGSRRALIQFYRLLDRLDARDRTSFVLRFIEGMDSMEVAQALGVSVSTARRSFSRAWDRITYLAQQDSFLASYVQDLGASRSVPSDELVPALTACG